MRLEPRPRPEQTVHVNARLITSSTILQLSSDELERVVSQEQIENPTLDVVEQRICLFCGTAIYGQSGQLCSACGQFAHSTQPPAEMTPYGCPTLTQWDYQQQSFYDIDNYGFVEVDRDDEYDPMAHIATNETLAERLLQQLEAIVPPDDAAIAEQLVGNLNERGYLDSSVAEIATHLEVAVEHVEYVLKQLQTLEPLGIGARNAKECLLIQLETLSELNPPHPLAYTLIDQHFDLLGHNQFAKIARKLKVSEQEVRQANDYIRSTLHPFPAYVYRSDTSYAPYSGATYIRPDIIIRRGENGLEVDLIEEKRYHFQTRSSGNNHDGHHLLDLRDSEVQRYMNHHSDRAKFFVDCIQRRWRTLRRVAELVVNYQREFLEKGLRRYLRPLTRAEVATRLNLDEGTISRATANKYAHLPNGCLMPLADPSVV
ncbi:MAG: hypothetical protein E6J34_09835 [Chloroflexi bacterium]|nr:MAG: hypothetical protein E6J34_09835 [Chloroflexota bacterium]